VEERKRILVVEDDATTRRLIEVMLARGGYDVVLSGDGEDAARRIEGDRFDLVITDLALPRANGLQVIKAVKRRGAGRVMVMSGHWKSSPLVAEAESLGCDGVIAKPFGRAQLLNAVAEQLE